MGQPLLGNVDRDDMAHAAPGQPQTAAGPIGPQPKTAAWVSGPDFPWLTVCSPTASGSTNAARARSTPSGIGSSVLPRAASGTTTWLAKAPSWMPAPMVLPSLAVGLMNTRMPGVTVSTLLPTASTIPVASWPSAIGRPSARSDPQLTKWRSLPQMPQAATRTKASRGPQTGNGASSIE